MLNLPLKIDYTGKVAVVTGAGGLICGAMARAFAQCGAKVAALDLNEEAVKKLAGDCPGYLHRLEAQLGDSGFYCLWRSVCGQQLHSRRQLRRQGAV